MEILTRYFLAMAILLLLLFIWHLVQKLSRKVATAHPEFGAAREEGGGCGGGGKCHCGNIKSCTKPKIKQKQLKEK